MNELREAAAPLAIARILLTVQPEVRACVLHRAQHLVGEKKRDERSRENHPAVKREEPAA